MIFVIAAAVGLVAAIVRRVPLSTIAEVRFRGIYLVAAAALLHVLLNPLVMSAGFSARLATPALPGAMTLPLGSVLNLASFACALAFLYVNRHLPGFTVILAGLALNVLVIIANGGQMPGDPAQLERAGLLQEQLDTVAKGLWSPFSLLEPGTPLAFLADRILIPMPFREPTVASVGDLVVVLGVLGFFNLPPARRRVTRAV
jgi:Family of unknown function (DUF5317)